MALSEKDIERLSSRMWGGKRGPTYSPRGYILSKNAAREARNAERGKYHDWRTYNVKPQFDDLVPYSEK